MFGWAVAIALFIIGMVNQMPVYILAAGLFAIAGSIGLKNE